MSDLKLLAMDDEDLEVISAHVQDSVVRVSDMGFDAAERRFALLMNRFDWENRSRARRKRTAVHFDHVSDVQVAGVDMEARDGILELLAVSFEAEDAPAGNVVLTFAGGGTVRLRVECLEARMRDLGAAWRAKATPEHDLKS